jgi:hypothetical protein
MFSSCPVTPFLLLSTKFNLLHISLTPSAFLRPTCYNIQISQPAGKLKYRINAEIKIPNICRNLIVTEVSFSSFLEIQRPTYMDTGTLFQRCYLSRYTSAYSCRLPFKHKYFMF